MNVITVNVYYLIGEALIIIGVYIAALNYLKKKYKVGKYITVLSSFIWVFLLDIRRRFVQGGYNSIVIAFTILLIILFFSILFFSFKRQKIEKAR
ncbi:hypothetical protein [Clostridium estertheticum]|uniref:hypothetical protein n=1 Tax=Clostridium estertheticum TaxID=238834 RepID=UPI001C6E9511|nr:hypothetical protein [Clostridium estertheticum]MBW9152911.1 hypothetical protein [Clostridium estertheticum]WLC82717.1 hypothetical protein KTC97_11250 [Clostridium estertheticum]